jgi:2-polyprenyl-3-methyl-5-hydroxy-6-metoxy-1,4-benzoquinol methylase
MNSTSHTQRYHEGQLRSSAWETERQRRLKRRVYETFSLWLEVHGMPPLRKGQSIVDLGSGAGHFVQCCREEELEATGIDIADGVNLERDPIPVKSSSADVVTAISVIEHLVSPANLLSEALRVLRPGGALILVSPNWQYSMSTFFDDPTHVHPYTPKSLKEVLGMYGFESIDIAPWLVKKPAWMWFVLRRFFVAYRLLPFRGDAPHWIPELLKGRSASLLAIARKPLI